MNAIPMDYSRFQSGYELSFEQKVAISIIVGVALLAIAIGLVLLHANNAPMLFQGVGEMREIVSGILIGVGAVAITGVLSFLTYLGVRHHLIKAAFEQNNNDDELLFGIEDAETCFWEFPLFSTPHEMRVHIKRGNSVETRIVFVVETEDTPIALDMTFPYVNREQLEKSRKFQATGQLSFCKFHSPSNPFSLDNSTSIQN